MREHVWPLLRRRIGLIALAGTAVVLSTGVQIAGPALVKYAVDEGLTKGRSAPLEHAVYAYVALAIAKPLLQRGITLWSARAGEAFLADLRTRAYERLQELSLPFFEGQRAGVLVSRLTADVQSLTTFVRMVLVEIVGNVLLFVVTLGVLAFLSPLLLLFTLSSLPILVVAWWRYTRLSRPAYLAIRDGIADTLATMQERFTGVRVIQAFRREQDAYTVYERSSVQQIEAWKRASYVNVGFWPMIAFAQAAALATVVVGGSILYDRGTVTLGTVAAFILYLTSLFEPLARVAEWFTELRSGQAALAKIVGVLQTPVAVPEHEEPLSLPADGEHVAEDVSFAYAEGRPVLEDVGVSIRPGERLALVGPTGAGKSTFAKLLTRKYDPLAGAVAFGEIDLRHAALTSLRERIVFVPQEGHLFSGTIADNVRLARPEASDEEVENALARLGALERFRALPEGLATDVRTRGVRLSAGERQLVALARVLLADPSVLVLDEATSSVDPGTERTVEQALARVSEGRTVITIAHRLSTAARADRVAVMRDGRLVELGSHDELVARGGFYARLWESWGRPTRGDAASPEPA
jgi:ATP-binding cassette subfamily B protein